MREISSVRSLSVGKIPRDKKRRVVKAEEKKANPALDGVEKQLDSLKKQSQNVGDNPQRKAQLKKQQHRLEVRKDDLTPTPSQKTKSSLEERLERSNSKYLGKTTAAISKPKMPAADEKEIRDELKNLVKWTRSKFDEFVDKDEEYWEEQFCSMIDNEFI